MRISGSNVGYTIFRGNVRVLATHSIRQFPLHFPSCASPCAITFQLDSTTVTSTSQLITIFLKISKFKNKNIQKSNERPVGDGAGLNRSDSEVQVDLDLNKKEKGFTKL
jgi:hypothetical protein